MAWALRRRALLAAACGALGLLGGCSQPPVMALRVGAHPWPGYELMYLARERGYITPERVRLIELPSASASLRALATESIEGAALTLDEVLTARSRGIDLVVVAVLDVSHGADVVLAQPGIESVAALRHRRIGVEPGAVGAVMLDAMLTRHGIRAADVQVVPLAIDQHERAFRTGRVEAVVTYEPVKTLLKPLGGRQLFSSAEIPGRIVDTLAVRRSVLAAEAASVRELVAGHFRALGDWTRSPGECAPELAPRLGVAPADVPAAYADLALPDLATNHRWLAQDGAWLRDSAQALLSVMHRDGLLKAEGPTDGRLAAALDGLSDGRFLPQGG